MSTEFQYYLSGDLNLWDVAIKSVLEKKGDTWELTGSLQSEEMLEVRQLTQMLMDSFHCPIPENFPMITAAEVKCVLGNYFSVSGSLQEWHQPFQVPELSIGPLDLEFHQSLVTGESCTELRFNGKASFASRVDLLGQIIFFGGEHSGIVLSIELGENELSLDELLEKCLALEYPEEMFQVTLNGGRVYYLHSGAGAKIDTWTHAEYSGQNGNGESHTGNNAADTSLEDGNLDLDANIRAILAEYPQNGLNIETTLLIHGHPYSCSMRLSQHEKLYEMTAQAAEKMQIDCIELLGPDLQENVGPALEFAIRRDPVTKKSNAELTLLAGLRIFDKTYGKIDLSYSFSERYFEGDFTYEGEILGEQNPQIHILWHPEKDFHLTFPSLRRNDVPYSRLFRIAEKILAEDGGSVLGRKWLFKEFINTDFTPKLIFARPKSEEAATLEVSEPSRVEEVDLVELVAQVGQTWQVDQPGQITSVVQAGEVADGYRAVNFQLEMTYIISVYGKTVSTSKIDLPLEIEAPENISLYHFHDIILENLQDNLHLIAMSIMSNPKEAATFFGAVMLTTLPRVVFHILVNQILKGKWIKAGGRLIIKRAWPIVKRGTRMLFRRTGR